MDTAFNLDAAIRKVADFPHEGILYYDITSILMDPRAFEYCVSAMVSRYAARGIDMIAAVESRGFIFGAPVARELRVPLLLVRKKGKLPGETVSATYDLEYGTDTIEMHRADLQSGRTILLVDDLIATGGTVRAAADLIAAAGSTVHEVCSVIGLTFLGYERRLAPTPVHTLITYDSE
jgi:adenine phosphoribosyltransferase